MTKKEVEIPKGKTTLGRGPFLDCADKKVSRNHATIEMTDSGDILLTSQHVNPCYYFATDANSTPQILKKDSTQKLTNGDIFSLMASAYKYQVIIEDGSVTNNDVDINKSDDKIDESSCNGETLKGKDSKDIDTKPDAKKNDEDDDTKDNDSIASDVKKNDKKVHDEKEKIKKKTNKS